MYHFEHIDHDIYVDFLIQILQIFFEYVYVS